MDGRSIVSLPMGVLVPLIPIGVLIVGMCAWPWIERWITKDDTEHHLLDRDLGRLAGRCNRRAVSYRQRRI